MRLATLAWTGLALASHASAFWGQMAASGYSGEGTPWQNIYLTDYNTGSTYQGILWGGFNGCSGGTECDVNFSETSAGGYNFQAKVWRSNDGCHNIDFEGAFSAHHGYCCGSLPCDFSA
ncbi:hypothetical protein BJY00DRAFT_307698 [Aspergillus carlsbadensis]|nr:hypothetical protein BJY00DRAFT_307698 [Aspergillus carlsbadensis]